MRSGAVISIFMGALCVGLHMTIAISCRDSFVPLLINCLGAAISVCSCVVIVAGEIIDAVRDSAAGSACCCESCWLDEERDEAQAAEFATDQPQG